MEMITACPDHSDGVLATLAISGERARAKSDRLAVGHGPSAPTICLMDGQEAGIFRKNGLDVDTAFLPRRPRRSWLCWRVKR